MASKKQNEMKVQIWTGTLTAKFDGGVAACTIESFGYIMGSEHKSAAQVRQIALNQMQKKHEELLAEGR